MDQDIWYTIGIHLDYENLMILCQVNSNLSHICNSNYFWMIKVNQDFGISEEDFDKLQSELETGEEIYIYYAGLNNLPIRGAEKYGNPYDLVKAAASTGNDQLVEYFYYLFPYPYIFKILGNRGMSDLIFYLNDKYPNGDNLDYAMKGAIKGRHRLLIDQITKHKDFSPESDMLYDAAESGNVPLFVHLDQTFILGYRGTENDLLRIATSKNNQNMVSFLLATGITGYDEGLVGAAESGNQELIDLMLILGAQDINGALLAASRGGHLSIFLQMKNKGATAFEEAFVQAANLGKISIMQEIINFRDISYQYDEALKSATHTGELEVIKFLLSRYKPTINYSPWTNANNQIIALKIIEALLPYIDEKFYQKMLREAAIRGQLAIFKKLISLGTDPFDDQILDEIFSSWNLNIMIELVKRGADYKNRPYLSPQFLPYLQNI